MFLSSQKWFVLIISLALSSIALSQDGSFLENYNQERLSINRTGMTVLGSWAVLNITSGLAGYGLSSGSTRYFYQFNAMWNTVNLGLAGLGYYQTTLKSELVLSLSETLKAQNQTENIFLLNSGLDIGYIAIGAFLYERSKHVSKNSNLLKGYGQSLWLQGGFLLVFDAIMYWKHQVHSKVLYEVLDNISLSEQGLGLVLKF